MVSRKYDEEISKSNVLEVWAPRFPSVMRWLGKQQRKEDKAYFLWLFCRWAGKGPEQLLALKESPKSVEAEKLLDTFTSLVNTEDAPYTNSVMWNSMVAVRSFFRSNYRALQPEAGKMDLLKLKPYNKPTKEERLSLYRATRNPRDRSLVTFVFSSAIARETITRITWGHLDSLDPEKKRTWEEVDIPHIGVEEKLLKGHGRGKWRGVEQHTFLTPEAKRDLIYYRDWWQRMTGIKFTQEMNIFWTVHRPWKPLSYPELGHIAMDLSEASGVPFSWHDGRRVVETALEETKIHPNWARKIRGRKVKGEENPYSRPEIEKLREAYRKAVPLLEFTTEERPSYEDMRKRQLLDTARLLGFEPERLKKLEELLARAKTVDEAITEFKRLKENPNPKSKENNIKIVKGEEALVNHMKQGWTLIKELNHDKYLLRSR